MDALPVGFAAVVFEPGGGMNVMLPRRSPDYEVEPESPEERATMAALIMTEEYSDLRELVRRRMEQELDGSLRRYDS